MGKYILGIGLTVVIFGILLYFISKPQFPTSQKMTIEITQGNIENGMPLGAKHEIESLDGKVTVGGSKSNNLEPIVTLSKLNDSAYLKVNYPINSDQVIATKNTITWKGKDQDLYFKQPSTDTFEFDILLHKKPNINIFEYSIDTKNLDFFYQPPLTKEEIAKGNFRAENVIGSYAVYYKNGLSGDYSGIGGLDYKTGKAFHIYRPKIQDANGKSIWGELTINTEENKLLVKVPQEFLDTGTYPIIVDPTFGYTSQGSSDDPLCGGFGEHQTAMRGDVNGIVTSISAYLRYTGATPDNRYFTLRTNSSGVPGSATYTSSQTPLSSTSYTLETVSSLNQVITNPYWVATGCAEQTGSGTSYIAYDSGGASGYGATTNDFSVWSSNDNLYSVYATYTPTLKTSLKGNINLKGNVNLK